MRQPIVFFALVLGLCGVSLAQTNSSQKPSSDPKLLAPPVLSDGTEVKLRVSPTVNTAAARLGDSIQLDIVEEVRVRDVVVIPASSMARAVVTSERAQPSGARDGKIDANLRYVVLVDGEKVALRSARQKKPGVSGSAVISAADAQDVTLSNGMELTAYIDGNLPIDVPKMRLANQPKGELTITTTPGSAEVAIDGNVAGTTPFSGSVPRGDHIVTLRAAGFQTWLRTVRITAEPAKLQVALTKKDGLESPPPAKTVTVSLGDAARAARAQKATQDGQKPAGEPIELINNDAPKPAGPQN